MSGEIGRFIFPEPTDEPRQIYGKGLVIGSFVGVSMGFLAATLAATDSPSRVAASKCSVESVEEVTPSSPNSGKEKLTLICPKGTYLVYQKQIPTK